MAMPLVPSLNVRQFQKPLSNCRCSRSPLSFTFSSSLISRFNSSALTGHGGTKCDANRVRKAKAISGQGQGQGQGWSCWEKEDEENHEEFQLLTAVRSKCNEISIYETGESRFLLLDNTHNVHSILNKGRKWTGSYWDEFASLPAIVPEGPIAILGLGGGTSAHLILDSWPSLRLQGWEIDEILIDKAREYFGLSDLEKGNQAGGVLCVHVGDALSPSATVPGGFAGIVVDLFSDGKVLPQLQEVKTWLELNNRLMSHGRIMVNCGGLHAETSGFGDVTTYSNLSQNDGLWMHNSTIKAMCDAFPGSLSWKKEGGGENYLALTGPMPDLDLWSTLVPEQLILNVKQWRPCAFKA